MSTDEMLIEISSYKYESLTHPYVFLTYNRHSNYNWKITWKKPKYFKNGKCIGFTPKEACEKALKFIHDNPKLFTK